MVREHIRISLTMFWTRASSKSFYKIIKSLNCPLDTGVNIRIIICLDDMLLMGRMLPEILMTKDALIFLLQQWALVST